MKNLEIERKFLLDINSIPYDLAKANKVEIEQGYLLYNPEVRVRCENNSKCYMMIKGGTDTSLTRKEITFDLTKSAYEQLIKRDDVKKIRKERYRIQENNNLLEIDVFKDNLEGLVCMEIEFPSEVEAKNFEVPSWTTKEVTDDLRYRNNSLARNSIPN